MPRDGGSSTSTSTRLTTLLRLDPRLFEALRHWAQDDLRSINAQIEYLLTEQVRRAGRLPHRPSRPVDDQRGAAPDDEDDAIESEAPAASRRR